MAQLKPEPLAMSLFKPIFTPAVMYGKYIKVYSLSNKVSL